jgi:hypothetical protein
MYRMQLRPYFFSIRLVEIWGAFSIFPQIHEFQAPFPSPLTVDREMGRLEQYKVRLLQYIIHL